MSAGQSYGTTSAARQFEAAMHAANIIPVLSRGGITDDGCINRFHVDGDSKGSQNGWAVLHGDGIPAGEFGSWKTSESHTWSAKHFSELTPAERTEQKRRVERAHIERERAQKLRHAEAARDANAAWIAAEPASDHPYLHAKSVRSHGLRIASVDGHGVRVGDLLIPIRNSHDELVSLQRITNSGAKFYLVGGEKRGCFYRFGGDGQAWLVEGYATGASVHQATGQPVVVAFDAGGMKPVADLLRGQLIGVAADNDESGAGQKAAEATGLPWVMPPTIGQDWNDYAAEHGAEVVRELLTRPAELSPINKRMQVDVHRMQPVGPNNWPDMNTQGRPQDTVTNMQYMLSHYGFTVRYDVIRKRVDVNYPNMTAMIENQQSVALATVRSLCAKNSLPKQDAAEHLNHISNMPENLWNPVADFIRSRPWDGRTRFGDLLATVEPRSGYDRDLWEILLRRWLISAVAAALKPSGFMSKGVLVFQGAQSVGKTSWFRSLVPAEMRDLIKVDAMIDPANKDTVISAIAHWLVELGELDGTLRRADIARLKGFISQDCDQFRRPYGRAEDKAPRRTVFFASVNPELFLADDTGNVRWWTVPVVRINYGHDIDMQQLWAEVATWYEAGERWWLNGDEEIRLERLNGEHQVSDPIGELIASKYGNAPASASCRPMTASEVLLEIGFDRPTKANLNEAAKALRAL
ncbi:MAG: VapE domain-containing protein, partial [Rhodanobacter sp.]